MFLKRVLLAFWALWYFLVFTSNAVDLLNYWGVFDPHLRFTSENFEAVRKTTARYGPPLWLNTLLFVGVMAWEGLCGFLFAYACLSLRRGRDPRRLAYPPFAVSLTLWAAFMLADEICLVYTLEGTHMRIFTAQLASLLAIHLLPDHKDIPPPPA